MRLDIRYSSTFTYSEPVVDNQNELRACPLDDDSQQLLDYRVTISPNARVFSFVDAWGTRVDAFGLRRSHDHMEVTAEASVQTQLRPQPPAAVRFGRMDDGFTDAHIEYCESDRHTVPDRAITEAARAQRALAGDDVVSTTMAIHRYVGNHLSYTPNSTEVGTGASEVLAGGVGVCQDYAHLAVTMCRSVGIPARYVSGYLFTADDSAGDAPLEGTVVVQTHAWFEAAIPGVGWMALDPTNGQTVGERHVKIGHGRSYDDVLPLRGTYSGPGASTGTANVTIKRMDAHATARGRLLGATPLQTPVGGPAHRGSAISELPAGMAGSAAQAQQQQ
ncbi:MAG: transglutaminase family protein [Microthrixaceae bacterium]